MPIDKIGSAEPYVAVKRNNFVKSRVQRPPAAQDTISLTSAAKLNAQMRKARDIAIAAPDLRIDKINELRHKIRSEFYPDQRIIGDLADRLLDQWSALKISNRIPKGKQGSS